MNLKTNDSQIIDPIMVTDGYMIKNGDSMQLNDVTKLSSARATHGKQIALGTNTSVVTFVRNFEETYPGIKNIQSDILYDAVLKDISLLPTSQELRNLLANAYDAKFNTNLNALYTHSAVSFDMLMTNTILYEYYQKMFYVYIMMEYITTHAAELTHVQFIDKYIEWIRPRKDPNAAYFIEGPKENSDFKVDNIVERYRAIISPDISAESTTSYLQLATQQQMSTVQQETLHFMQTNPNVYTKTPNEQSKYLLSIDSADKVLVSIDQTNNNLIFDCSNLTVGDLAEGGNTARLHEIKLDMAPRPEVAKDAIRSIRELFNHYGRIKIINLTFTKNTFITSLTAFQKVFVVFEGVSCDERAMYNTAMAPFLKIGGYFKENAKGDYEFVSDADAITYKPARVNIDSFKIYVTTSPTSKNKISPNQYTLKVNTLDIYQHPYRTNLKPNETPTVRLDNYTYYDSTTDEARKNVETAYYLNEVDALKAEASNVIASNAFTVPAANAWSTKPLKQLVTHFNSMLGYLATIFEQVQNTPFTNYVKNSINNYISALSTRCSNILAHTNTVTTNELNELTTLLQQYDTLAAKQLLNTIIQGFSTVYDFTHITLSPLANTSSIVPLVQANVSSTYQPALQQYIDDLADITDKDAEAVYNDCAQIIRNIPLSGVQIVQFTSHLQCIFSLYTLTARLFYFDVDRATLNTHISQRIVEINTQNATIEGKFFRMINGKPVFTDPHTNVEYTTPDPEYLEFSEEQNDLLLYNLFKYSRGNVEVIPNSSYRYSAFESTIERIPYTLLDCSKIFGSLRFNNSYQLDSYTILPNFKDMNAANNEIHWDQLEQLYQNDIFIYYKVVTESPSGTTTEYRAVNVKNNALTDSIPENKIVAVYDVEHEIWIDTLETENRYVPQNMQQLTIAALFNTIANEPFIVHTTVNGEDAVQTVQTAMLNALTTKKFYNKYYDMTKNLVYNTDYINITTEIADTTEMDYALTPNTSFIIPFDANRTVNDIFTTDLLQYYDHLNVTSLFNNYIGDPSDIYFRGFIKRQSASSNIYYLTGTITERQHNATYIVSLTGFPGTVSQNANKLEFTSQTQAENIKFLETDLHPQATVTYKDYFSNELVISGATITSSLAETLDELHGKTMKVQDNNSNTVTVTYTVKHYATCIEITIDTGIKTALALNFDHEYTYVDISGNGDVCISTSSNGSTFAAKPLVVLNDLGMFCDERNTYQQDIFSENINKDMSNAFRAFKINGYGIINKYWNNDIYDYSILHAQIPFKPVLSSVPPRVSIEYTNDKNTDVYTYAEKSKAITKLSGTYTITPTDILSSADAATITSLHVYKHEQKAYSYEADPNNYIFGTSPVSLKLLDSNDREALDINIIFNNEMTTITGVELFGTNRFYNRYEASDVYYTKSLPLCTYNHVVISGVPFYIDSNYCKFKAIIEFTANAASGNVEFSNISVTETVDELIYYEATAEGTKQCILPHIHNNNIPGDIITATDEIMNLQMTHEQYRYHPCYAYIENSFAEAKYVNTNEDLITMLNVYNQNTQVMNANIKSENTLSDSDAYKVGNMLSCSSIHVVESLDDNMLMISDFDKRDVLDDIAIQKDQIYVIPRTTRMTLSLEFS